MKQSDKKVSFDDPQNGGHFSCRKPVSHVGTSTVSDSEALIHLAYVQHMWQSKFVVILEGLTRWNWIVFKDATSWEWLQMHFDMHVCLLEKVLLCSFDSKTFCKFCTFLDPKMEVEKWTQKWCQNLTPKMGSKNGTQKGGPIFFWLKKIYKKSKLYLKYWVSLLGAIFGPHFGGQILAPFLGPFFNLHFGVQKWCKFCKSFCCQSCIAKLFPANKHAYQNASVVISQLIASFNTIQSSTWSSLPK